MKIHITTAAEAAIDELDDWWRENRPASRLAIALEVKRIIGLLQESPNIGTRFDIEAYPSVRRIRLQGTPYYLYYEFLLETDELTVVAVRSAMRGKGPAL